MPMLAPLHPSRRQAREPILLEWLCAAVPREGGDPRPPSEGGALPDGARRRDPGEDGPAFDDDETADDEETVS
jgi:hypothetical protein